MTVAVGFKCDDGVILSTDSQYTMGAAKTDGPKIFICADTADFAVAVAGAGRIAFMKRAVEKIEDSLLGLKSPTHKEIRLKVEESLVQFHKDYIYPMPADKQEKARFELIVGVWSSNGGFQLLKTEETTVDVVKDNYCSIGWGFYVTDYALNLMASWEHSVEGAKLVAAICVKAAKDHVDYCGGDTRMIAVHDTPPFCIERILASEIKDIEDYASELTETLRMIISALDIKAESSSDDAEYLDAVTNSLKGRMAEFREKQQKARESAKRRQQRVQRRLLKG